MCPFATGYFSSRVFRVQYCEQEVRSLVGCGVSTVRNNYDCLCTSLQLVLNEGCRFRIPLNTEKVCRKPLHVPTPKRHGTTACVMRFQKRRIILALELMFYEYTAEE